MKTLRVALAQINPTVGDLSGNARKIIEYMERAAARGAAIVAFPELALTGYPPEDLLLKPKFIEDNIAALEEISRHARGIVAVAGFVDRAGDIYNSAAVMADGRVIDVYHKMFLPNYGVFDEMRYFQAGTRCPVYEMGDTSFGVTICEDIWYPMGPARTQALGGAEFIININGSPYTIGKNAFREKMIATRASDCGAIVLYLNMVGGQDELVFDGGSLVLDERGNLAARANLFEEELLVVDLDLESVFMWRLHDPRRRQEKIAAQAEARAGVRQATRIPLPPPEAAPPEMAPAPLAGTPLAGALQMEEEVYKALKLGLADYVRKNGFNGVIIGLSGGVDSALVATIAADALGKDRVHALFMPSRYTSRESCEDVAALASSLGIVLDEISIEPVYKSYLAALSPVFKGAQGPGTAEENIQARIRGNLLMALSNKFGWLVVTTGNKSEMSTGYATLYGDMAGGFALIKDVPKTLVYLLANWRNRGHDGPLIPGRIISKEPTAELKANQKDTDTLPPYPVLDPVITAYVENDKSFEEILTLCDAETAQRIIRMIDRSEYKRRQAPPGIKITPRAFGRDRRLPITNGYRNF
ncbi:MAG: NAD+ synthase [Nitrospiraceae bacterium]|nr:NAD+ synthase [Nitrospiraceae bacterium]